VLGVVGVAALAAMVGSLLAARGANPPAVPASDRPGGAVASTRELSLKVPASWSLADDVNQIAGLPLDESMQLVPSRKGGGGQNTGLLVGVVRQANDRLLPPGFADRVTSEPVGERVRIGRYEGYRYAGLVLRGSGRRLTLYAVPTSEGAATVACFAQPAAEAFLPRCESVATTLSLSALDAKPLGPGSAYLGALDANLQRLNARRRAGRTALSAARTPAGQARRADGLARAYALAADEQSRAPRRLDDPQANETLVALMRDVRRAYVGVASGARGGSRREFSAAAEAVAVRERRLGASIDELRRAGVPPGD
jgi:hypothetical protein